MGTSKDRRDEGGLPWYVGDPDPTAEVVEEIVYWFHTYAMLGQRKLDSANEEEKKIARTFIDCIPFVMEYFKDKAKQIDTAEARDIAAKAMDLVDEFYGWFEPRGQFTKQDWEPYIRLFSRWKRVMRRFYMLVETKSGKSPSKRIDLQEDIPGTNRTSPMSQKELAELWKGSMTQKTISSMIKNRALRAIRVSRQAFIFDKSQLPPRVNDKLSLLEQ